MMSQERKMAEHLKEIDDNGFEDHVLRSQAPALVDFWAPWCSPCRALGPIVEDLAAQYGDKMNFAKLNIDNNPATPTRFGIKAIPTIAIFKGGRPVEMITGLTSRGRLEKSIKDVLEGVSAAQPFIVQ
jgi:thioredoxin 1